MGLSVVLLLLPHAILGAMFARVRGFRMGYSDTARGLFMALTCVPLVPFMLLVDLTFVSSRS